MPHSERVQHVVVELTTLELEAHPEGGSYPATDSEVRVDEANAIAELDVVVVTAEAEGSSVPEFEEPVCRTILDEGSLVRRLLSGLLSLQGTRGCKSAECKRHYFRLH